MRLVCYKFLFPQFRKTPHLALLVLLLSFATGCGFLNKLRKSHSVVHGKANATVPDEEDPDENEGLVATRLAILVQPSGGIVDEPIHQFPKIAAYSENNRIVRDYDGEVSVDIASGPGGIAGTTTLSFTKGVAEFTDLRFSAAGTYRLKFVSKDFESLTSSTFQIFPRFSGGDGLTIGSAFQISNIHQLQGLASEGVDHGGVYFELAQDIDATETKDWHGGKGFLPIGRGTAGFAGIIDGKRKTIANLYIDRTDESSVGIFASLNAAAQITRLVITDASVKGADFVGIIAGKTSADVFFDLFVDGVVVGQEHVGGIAGCVTDTGSAHAIYVKAKVEGVNEVGGVFGCIDSNGTTQFVVSDSSVVASGSKAGGLVGKAALNVAGDRIIFSVATGDVRAEKGEVGGAIGYLRDGGVLHVVGTGSVYAGSNGSTSLAGGLIGEASDVNISSSFASVPVYAVGSHVGGLLGRALNASITASAANGWVYGSDVVAGFAGELFSSSLLASGASGIISVASGGTKKGLVAADAVTSTDRNFFYASGVNTGLDCSQNDISSNNCYPSTRAMPGATSAIAFDRYLLWQPKIGLSDEASFAVSGTCDPTKHGDTVTVNFVSGVTGTSVSGACNQGRWKIDDIDLSTLIDGSISITATLGSGGSASLSLTKETNFCKTHATTQASGFAAGAGTSGDPFIICNKEQWDNFAAKKTAGMTYYFRLANTISLGLVEKPIGTYSGADCASHFCNNFDGDGFRLTNAVIMGNSNSGAMFAHGSSIFGEMRGATTKVANVIIDHARIFGGDDTAVVAGRIYNEAEVSDVFVDAIVVSKGARSGGVAGDLSDAALQRAHTNVIVVSYGTMSGGVLGRALSGPFTVTNTLSSLGVVSNLGGYGGGAVGVIDGDAAQLVNSKSQATVIGSSPYVGGLLGGLDGGASLQHCYANGNVFANTSSVGGLVGAVSNIASNVQFVYATGSVIGSDSAGGLFGSSYAIVNFSAALNDYVMSTTNAGAFVGQQDGGSDILNSVWAAENLAQCGTANAGSAQTGCSYSAFSTFLNVDPNSPLSPVPFDAWMMTNWVQSSAYLTLPALAWE